MLNGPHFVIYVHFSIFSVGPPPSPATRHSSLSQGPPTHTPPTHQQLALPPHERPLALLAHTSGSLRVPAPGFILSAQHWPPLLYLGLRLEPAAPCSPGWGLPSFLPAVLEPPPDSRWNSSSRLPCRLPLLTSPCLLFLNPCHSGLRLPSPPSPRVLTVAPPTLISDL